MKRFRMNIARILAFALALILCVDGEMALADNNYRLVPDAMTFKDGYQVFAGKD